MSKDTATQEGVDKSTEETEVLVGNVERNETIERIAKAAREARDKELAEAGHEVVDTTGAAEPEAEQTEQKAAGEEAAPEVQTETHAEKPAERMVRVKVDGVEKEVPESLILDAGLRAVQKESAADQRLAEASRILREAQELATPKKQPLPNADEAELANRIRFGNDEEAQEAISILMGRNQATPEQIAYAVETKILADIENKETLKWFSDTYKPIVEEPYLLNIAIAEENRLRAEGDTRDYKTLYTDIGNNILNKLNEWKGGKATVATSEDKKSIKSNIVNLPTASARQQAPEQPKPKTPSQIIDDMRKARGQA